MKSAFSLTIAALLLLPVAATSADTFFVTNFGVNTITQYDENGFSTNFTNSFVNGPNGIPVPEPAGMSAVASPFAVLVQLIWVNGMVVVPLVNDAGDVTESVPLPDPFGVRTQPPTYTCAGGLHTAKLS